MAKTIIVRLDKSEIADDYMDTVRKYSERGFAGIQYVIGDQKRYTLTLNIPTILSEIDPVEYISGEIAKTLGEKQ